MHFQYFSSLQELTDSVMLLCIFKTLWGLESTWNRHHIFVYEKLISWRSLSWVGRKVMTSLGQSKIPFFRKKFISKSYYAKATFRILLHHRPIQQYPVLPLQASLQWLLMPGIVTAIHSSLPTSLLGFHKLSSLSRSRYLANYLNLAFKNKTPCIYFHLKPDQRKRSSWPQR